METKSYNNCNRLIMPAGLNFRPFSSGSTPNEKPKQNKKRSDYEESKSDGNQHIIEAEDESGTVGDNATEGADIDESVIPSSASQYTFDNST